jgi:squalene synthase HpnC
MRSSASSTIQSAFAHCENMARQHYENFPVASLLLPRKKRPYVAAVYAFARTADDFADEGELTSAERLDRLDDWERRLLAASKGNAEDPVFIALAETMARTRLPLAPLSDLLTAFKMDVSIRRYATFADLLQYCRYSANPVGQIVLYLFGRANGENIAFSDRICTGLQLANFWQDVSVDWMKGRLYLPLEDLRQFGYTEEQISQTLFNDQFRALMVFEVERAAEYLVSGMPLPGKVGLRLRCELALTIQGGLGILRRIRTIGYDVLHHRPVLRTSDKARIFLDALFSRTQ